MYLLYSYFFIILTNLKILQILFAFEQNIYVYLYKYKYK